MEGMGERILSLLEKDELTQKEFAKKINVTPQAFNNYVLDLRSPSLETVVKICDELNCSADYLLGRSELPRNSDDERVLRALHRADPDLQALVLRSLGIQEKKKMVS